jgi:hypothetical protein
MTHKVPIANMIATAALPDFFILSLKRDGIGKIRMTKSCAIASALVAKLMALRSPHLPLTSLSQNARTGAQAKMLRGSMMIVLITIYPSTIEQVTRN